MAHGPVDDFAPTSIWTGAALLTVDTRYSGPTATDLPGQAAVWDPSTDAWNRLPGAPFVRQYFGNPVVWTGRELLEWGLMKPKEKLDDPPPSTIGLSFGL